MYTLLSWVEYMSGYSTHPIEWILTHFTQLNRMHQLDSSQLNWVERNALIWVYPYIHNKTDFDEADPVLNYNEPENIMIP